jgi:hypothetical protein
MAHARDFGQRSPQPLQDRRRFGARLLVALAAAGSLSGGGSTWQWETAENISG